TSYMIFLMVPTPPGATLFPYTTLFRSGGVQRELQRVGRPGHESAGEGNAAVDGRREGHKPPESGRGGEEVRGVTGEHVEVVGNRSEEHTSELQSRENLVCRLLLEKKKR